jgi:PTS system galactitol-specific IIB component
MKKKLILVVCGTGVATSTLVAAKVEEEMQARGIPVSTQQCKAAEVRSLAPNADLIVATTPVPNDLGKPVIKGLAFLTGIGRDAVLDQIEKALRG